NSLIDSVMHLLKFHGDRQKQKLACCLLLAKEDSGYAQYFLNHIISNYTESSVIDDKLLSLAAKCIKLVNNGVGNKVIEVVYSHTLFCFSEKKITHAIKNYIKFLAHF